MILTVLLEDDQLLVVNKPPGIVVNRADSVRTDTIQDWVDRTYNWQQTGSGDEAKTDFYLRSGIVHRLDKETSGALIIAKNQAAYLFLSQQFARRQIGKTYLALVHGQVQPPSGKITAPVARNPFNRERFGVFPGGRPAETNYRSIANYRSPLGESLSLLELKPSTGRTHQIRVHLKFAGWPVVSDVFYGGRKRARQDRQWCSRLFLHASKIEFYHPVAGQKHVVEAPLLDDLEKVLANCLR